MAVTDALGKATVLAYCENADPLKITKITDPFSGTALFTSDASRRL